MTRLDQLLEFLKDDPNDPFNIYAVATEYLKSDPAKAMQLFDQLMRDHKEYLPTYYHAGKLLTEFDDIEKAKKVLLQGIAVAKDKKDQKALRELQSAYDEIAFD